MSWDGQLAGEMVKGAGVFVLKRYVSAGRTAADASYDALQLFSSFYVRAGLE